MRTQKRYSSSSSSGNHPRDGNSSRPRRQSQRQREPEEERERERGNQQAKEEEKYAEDWDSDSSRWSDDPANLPEWLDVDLQLVESHARCPICLGIIKQTRTVTGCMHRFCKECIDKSMRLGKNECPACRKHCPSRRSLRADIRYDAIIASVYDDIDKYEEEIQASISRTFQHQSEALTARPKKNASSSSTTRLQRNYRNAFSRRRNNNLTVDPKRFEDEEDSNHSDNSASSSSEDWLIEIRRRRQRRKRAGGQSSQPAPSPANLDGGNEYVPEESRENIDTSSGPMLNPDIVAWGGAGVGRMGVQSTCGMNLTEHLESLKEDDDKLYVQFMLASLDKQRIPSLQAPYLSFPPYFSVEQIKEYVARETQIRAEDIEILLVNKHSTTTDLQFILNPSTSLLNKVVLHTLEGQETLAGLRATCANGDQLMQAIIVCIFAMAIGSTRQGAK